MARLFEHLETRRLLSVSPDSLLVQVPTGANIAVPDGYELGPVVPGGTGYTYLRHNTTNDAAMAAAASMGFGYVGLNPTVQLDKTPNDPLFGDLWGMSQISAESAWNIRTDASSVVIGSIDTGLNLTHPDLVNNLWTNPGEIPGNGVDDDGNGFIDDIHGWDFKNNDNDPTDDNSHGSHTMGTFGGEGDNSVGVVGVSWDIQVMAIKVFGASGGSTVAEIIPGIEYANLMQVDLTNNSWGGRTQPDNPAWAPMKVAIEAGPLFVASAGNSATNNDGAALKNLPAAWDSPNILSVAASTQTDDRASFSSYGATTIDVAAPGVGTVSTCLGATYCTKQGTSMAAPHAAGVAALLMADNPAWTDTQVKDRIMATVDKVGPWGSLVASGGRLNAFAALNVDPPANLPPVAVDDAFQTDQDMALVVPPTGVLANDSDPDGDPLTASVVSDPTNGTLNLMADGSFTYTPDMGFSGVDSFVYAASDGEFSDEATVEIMVVAPQPPNQPPVGVPDFYRSRKVVNLNQGSVLRNDSDPDGDPLTAILVSEPSHGRLKFDSDGSFHYKADNHFMGIDSFVYRAVDSSGLESADTLVELDILGVGNQGRH